MIAIPRTVTLRKPAVKAVDRVVTLRIAGAANLPAGAPSVLRLFRGSKSRVSSILLRNPAMPTRALSGSGRPRKRRSSSCRRVRACRPAGVPCTPTFGLPCHRIRAALAVRSNVVRIVIPKRK